ncbi:MAG: hypothetical protein JSS66_10870 [Armatimonadetes bacterium]|nr:hypothetical protein [Armatimonadota bacterium]
MQAKARWLHMVGLVALIFGALPVSALAMLCQPAPCTMPCCAAKQAKPQPEPQKASKAACNHGEHSAKADKDASKPKADGDPCKCTIKSKNTDSPERLLPSTLSFKTPELVAILTPVSTEVAGLLEVIVLPGVFASDSGPPKSFSSLPWLGRAPPVRTA